MHASVLLALAFLSSQDADTKVSFETVAVPLSRALEEINKSAGTNWKAAPQTQNDIVVLRLQNVPASLVKERLAKAVAGTWTKLDDGSEQIAPDTLARSIATQANVQKRLKSIEAGLTRLRQSLAPGKKEDPDTESGPGFGFSTRSGFGSKLIAQMSLGLRASDLAAVKKGERVVYSVTPTAVQRRLVAANLAPAVNEFIIAHNKTVTATDDNEGMDPAMREQIEKVQGMFGDMLRQPKRIDTPPKEVLLVTERGGLFGFMGDTLTLHVLLFDSKGDVQASASESLTGGMMDMARTSVSGAETVETPVADKEVAQEKTEPGMDKPVELSKLSLEFQSLMDFGDSAPKTGQPSKELMERLLRPDLYDPLSFEASESLLALAKAQGANLVAVMPDGEMDMAAMAGRRGSRTLASVKSALKDNEDLVFESKDGWLSVGPSDPEATRLGRVDRRALAAFLKSAVDTVVPSLDALAAYAASNPPLMETPVVMPHVMLIAPNAISAGMRGMQDWPMLRLYGLLSPAERANLRQGQGMRFGSFNPKAQEILRQMVFGAGAKLQVGPDKENVLGMFAGISMGGSTAKSYKEEPTELLPNGLPASGLMKLEAKPSHFVMTSKESTGMFAMMMGAMGPQEYAMLKYFSEEPKMAQFTAMMPKLDKFQIGERETLDFRLVLAEDVSQKHTLIDNRMPKNAAFVGPEALPKDFLAEVDKQMKLYKEGLSPLMNMGGMFGGGVPPR